MSKFKKIAAAVLAVTMGIGLLSGCGSKSNGALNTIDKNTIYKEEKLDINFPSNFNVNTVAIAGTTAYFSGYSYNEQTYEQKLLIQVVDLESNAMKSIDLKLENGWVSGMTALSDGNIAVVCQINNYDYSDPENPIYENSLELRVYDNAGNMKGSMDLSKDYEASYVSNLIATDTGLIISCYGTTIITDNSLKVLTVKKSEGDSDQIENIYKLRDGSFAAMKWGEGGYVFYRLDINSLTLGEQLKCSAPISNYSIVQGRGYDLFLRGNTDILAYNFGDEEAKPIFSFINSDLYNSYFNVFEPYGDDCFIGTYSEYGNDGYKYNVCKYTKVKPEDVKDKTVLSLGCLWMDSDLRKFVVDFNKSSEEYRINVIDYSSYNTEEDYEAGLTKFNSDVAAGKGPDIIVSSNLDKVANFIDKGLYADLSKFFEKDPDVSLDDLLPNIVEATSKNGKIYQIIPNFRINTVLGKSSVLGGRTGWTIGEMLEFANTIPADKKLFHEMTRESFLSAVLAVNASEFIDLDKAKCNFDSDEFKKVLEYMAKLQKSDDYYNTLYGSDDGMDFDWQNYENEVRNGFAILQPTSFYYVDSYKEMLRFSIGEEISFVGYPSETREGSVIYASMSIGISSKCKHQDGAWELVRKFLVRDEEEDGRYGYGMSCLKSEFEKECESLKERPYWINENGNKEYYDDTRWDGVQEVVLDPLTDAEVQVFKDYVYSVNKLASSYTDIENIIYEEAQAYFEGQKSVDDVVKIIQSRASIFVSENQ